jgi:hypothetical protein
MNQLEDEENKEKINNDGYDIGTSMLTTIITIMTTTYFMMN